MLELAQKYAALCNTKILAHRINGREITFVLASGPKLTMTESQLNLAIVQKTEGVGTVGGGTQTPAASPEVAPRATKSKTKKEG